MLHRSNRHSKTAQKHAIAGHAGGISTGNATVKGLIPAHHIRGDIHRVGGGGAIKTGFDFHLCQHIGESYAVSGGIVLFQFAV